MAGAADQTLAAADMPATDEGRNVSGVKSDAPVTSSMTLAIIKMAVNKVPEMSDYWKKSTITEADRQAYHDFGWLTGNLMSTIPKVDFPTTHGSTMVCFESHLIARLGLPPSKFLVDIMNFLAVSWFISTLTPSLHSAACPCCVNVGWEFPQILVYSGTFIPRPNTARLFTL
jgi:hypothetical protein